MGELRTDTITGAESSVHFVSTPVVNWVILQSDAGVTLIDTGEEAARAAAELLSGQDQLNDTDRAALRRYYASDSAEDFAATAKLFLGKDISDRVERVAIENY